MNRPLRTTAILALVATAACGGAHGQTSPTPAAVDAQSIPVGFGRLNQEDLSLKWSAGDLEIRFLPLDEQMLRLLATDGYRAMHDLRESRRVRIDSIARQAGSSEPGVALITFFAARSGQQFQPQDIALSVQNQEFRAIGIIPISANFSSQQLAVRGQASALYVFDTPIPVTQEFTLSYQGARTDGWKERVTTINREHDRVMLRARSTQTDSTRTP
jgi:hypothetical protein